MKKPLLLPLLLLALALALTGCGQPAKQPGPSVDYSFYDSTRKVTRTEPLRDDVSYTIRLARNEAEGCQLVFAPSELTGCTLSCSDFTNGDGYVLPAELFEEYYIPCESNILSGFYPDALVPVADGHPLSLNDGFNHPFYLKVRADKDAPAGMYTAALTVTDAAGGVLSIPVTAQVWDFTLPDTPACTTAFGLDRQYIAEYHGLPESSDEAQAMYEAYYEFLLEHNISAYDLPYDILDERADAYLNDPRMTSFCIPYFDTDHREDAAEVIRAYRDKLTSNPMWADKGYFYAVDEPSTAEHYGWYLETVEWLETHYPGYHMVMPTHIIEFEEEGEYYHSVLMHALGADIFCPLSVLLENEAYRADVEEYLPDAARWWYVCCGPVGEYCNVLMDFEGIRARILLWQQMDFGVTGLLYWSSNYWEEGSPWDNGWTYRATEDPDWSFEQFGDGSLLYPGSEVGVDGPIASLRLEILSDGIDDFDYLTLAKEKFGQNYVDEKIAQVTASLTEYTHDDTLLRLVREQIGADLAAAGI